MTHAQAKCDGSCTQHDDDLRLVHVWYGTHDWGLFTYCGVARKEDERRGLTVLEVHYD